MVAHIWGDDAARAGEPFGDDVPIARGAEEAVDDQDGRARGIGAMDDCVEHGCVFNAQTRWLPEVRVRRLLRLARGSGRFGA